MEGAASIYAIGSATAAIAGSPASSLIFEWFANWFHKKRLAKRVRGLILIRGVTTMCQKLTSPECVYIDCDSLHQTLQAPKSAEEVGKPSNPVDEILAFSIIKKHIINITNVFKGKIILVSKNNELLKSLPVKCENTFFAAFSKEMESNIGVIFPNEKEHHDAEVAKFRIMRELNEDRVFINDNMKELYENVSKKFGSKRVVLLWRLSVLWSRNFVTCDHFLRDIVPLDRLYKNISICGINLSIITTEFSIKSAFNTKFSSNY